MMMFSGIKAHTMEFPCLCFRLVHEVKVSEMKRHKLEVQSADSSSPNTDNFRLIVVSSCLGF